ncbi:MAG: HEAT repeat domain-containing protein, partial [Candidatus Binatia bacterium]
VPDAAVAAAVSLGAPGNHDAVAPLARLLASDDERLRFAAIRGLGRIGGAEAVETLQEAAAFHPDAATRRRAGAEAAVMGGRVGSRVN